MAGDPDAWRKMMEYCVNDTRATEDLYFHLLPWIDNHPAHGLYNDEEHVCPNCGGKHLIQEGYAYTALGKFHRYSCKDCGRWSRGKKNVAAKEIVR